MKRKFSDGENSSLDFEDSHNRGESVKNSMIMNDKLQGNSTIIFSIANAMMGPSVLLLPLNFMDIGLLSSTVVAFFLCLVSYRTCDLTHLHTRPDEIEYISAIERIMGKTWNSVYFVNSVVILWMAGMIYFLSLCDVTYSALQLIFNVTWPAEETITFDTFSYQYIGIIIMILIGWLFFLPKLGKILDLTEKGIYSIIAEGLFLVFLGGKALLSGSVKFVFHSDNVEDEVVAFTTSFSIVDTVGVFAMAFAIHNSVVAIVRKSREPSKSSRNVALAYVLTFGVYVITGVFGCIGLYTKKKLNPNTVLNNTLYDRNDTFTLVLLIITQLMTSFQLVTVLPVVNNIVRNQFFIMIWGEEGVPPRSAFIGFNLLYIISFLIIQIFNISPGTVMKYGGAFIGFVIIYLLPVGIHLKALRTKQRVESEGYRSFKNESDNMKADYADLPDFLRKKDKINYVWEYGVHGVIMAVGVAIFISQLVGLF